MSDFDPTKFHDDSQHSFQESHKPHALSPQMILDLHLVTFHVELRVDCPPTRAGLAVDKSLDCPIGRHDKLLSVHASCRPPIKCTPSSVGHQYMIWELGGTMGSADTVADTVKFALSIHSRYARLDTSAEATDTRLLIEALVCDGSTPVKSDHKLGLGTYGDYIEIQR